MLSPIGRSRRACSVLLLAMALGGGASRDAFAQPADNKDAKKEAETIFQAGLKHYDAREFEKARVEFKKAYGLYQSPGILRNLALSELYSGRAVDALRHLNEYVARPDVPQDKREEAKKYIEDAYAKTGHVKITATDGAAIIAGDRTYKAPLATPVDVAAGAVTVIARGGGREVSKDIVAPAGTVVDVDLTFGAQPDPVTNNGKPPGNDNVVSPPPIEPTPRESFWGWRSIAGLVAGGVGVAGLVVGAVSASESSSEGDRVTELQEKLPQGACAGSTSQDCRDLADALDSERSASDRATVGFVIGGVALAAGVGLVVSALVWPHRTVGALHLVPTAGPRHAGFSVVADF